MVQDPRWIEYRDAYAESRKGLEAAPDARERFARSQLPYCELLADHTAGHLRKHMMLALFNGGMSWGIIAMGFKATTEEGDFVRDQPVVEPQLVDEVERLARLPYAAYLKTEHWRKVRDDALKRAENRCMLCNSAEHLQVHHRSYKHKGCERPIDVSVLCDECHQRHHGKIKAA